MINRSCRFFKDSRIFTENKFNTKFTKMIIPIMQRETGLVRKLLAAYLAEVLLLARVSGLVINQVRLRLETGIARLTDVRSIVRVHQLMTLQQLFVLEALVAFVADETTTIVVLGLFVIHDGAGVV